MAKSIAGYTNAYNIGIQAAQKVIGVVAELAKQSVVLAAAQERVKMEFSVLTGSMETANKLFAQMNQLASQTPLEMADITAAGKQLLSVGVPVDQITEKLRMLGDVAMGNPEKLDRLVSAFGQLRSKGVASMEQLNRFIEAGVPIMAELQKQTGKTGDEVFKMVSSGKIGFAQVEEALRSLTGEGGLMEGMMAKVAQTTEGKFSTALDNAKLKLADIGKNLMPVVTKALDAFNRAMDESNRKDAVKNLQKTVEAWWKMSDAQKANKDNLMGYGDALSQLILMNEEIIKSEKASNYEKKQAADWNRSYYSYLAQIEARYEKQVASQNTLTEITRLRALAEASIAKAQTDLAAAYELSGKKAKDAYREVISAQKNIETAISDANEKARLRIGEALTAQEVALMLFTELANLRSIEQDLGPEGKALLENLKAQLTLWSSLTGAVVSFSDGLVSVEGTAGDISDILSTIRTSDPFDFLDGLDDALNSVYVGLGDIAGLDLSDLIASFDELVKATENEESALKSMLSYAGNTAKSISNLVDAQSDKEIKAIEDRLEAARDAGQDTAAIEEELTAKKNEQALKQFNTAKALAMAQAAIDGFVAINKAYSQFGVIGGAIMAGLVAVNEIAIASEEFVPMAEGGSGTVKKPTHFLAGEAGEEDYIFAPKSKGGLKNSPAIKQMLASMQGNESPSIQPLVTMQGSTTKSARTMVYNTYHTTHQHIAGSVLAEKDLRDMASSANSKSDRGF
jgi:tape measure domain-containing protein